MVNFTCLNISGSSKYFVGKSIITIWLGISKRLRACRDVQSSHSKNEESGTLSWLRQEIVQNFDKEKDASKVNDAHVLAFEKVAFPFLALLTGVMLSFVQLSSEFLTSYGRQLCSREQK